MCLSISSTDFSVVWCKFYMKSYLPLLLAPALPGGLRGVHILDTRTPSGAPKITISSVHAYVASVRLYAWSNSKTAEVILMKFDNGELLKSVIIYQFWSNQTKITYCHMQWFGVTNNNGFWIRWLGYWHFFTITGNYNRSHIEILLHDAWPIFRIHEWTHFLYLPRGPNISHHVEQLTHSVVTGMALFSGLLPSNDSFVAVRCSGTDHRALAQ
jgi:hypothetical protein